MFCNLFKGSIRLDSSPESFPSMFKKDPRLLALLDVLPRLDVASEPESESLPEISGVFNIRLLRLEWLDRLPLEYTLGVIQQLRALESGINVPP